MCLYVQYVKLFMCMCVCAYVHRLTLHVKIFTRTAEMNRKVSNYIRSKLKLLHQTQMRYLGQQKKKKITTQTNPPCFNEVIWGHTHTHTHPLHLKEVGYFLTTDKYQTCFNGGIFNYRKIPCISMR